MSIKNQVESIIFLGGDENKIKDLAKFFKISVEDMLKILLELKDDRKDTGINLEVDSEIVYLSTNPLYGEVINNYFEQETKPKKLSSASIETLSIIAYKQPITKSEIESIRGVSVDRIISNLEERKFVQNCGKQESGRKANLYEVTDKFLSTLGIASRRAIDKYIEEGRITVNYNIAIPGMDINENDDIFIDGKRIETKINDEKVYFMLNKPLEVLSASSDDRGRKTVVDLIKTDKRIFPIGRLDYMTSGLILLTNDGELFNRIVHPKSEIYKKYYIKIFGEIKKEEIDELKKGVLLDDGKTLPAKISGIKYDKNKTSMYISIREGRNRQVRRMIEKFGYKVLMLRREKIGELSLGDLPEGKYRELTNEEIEYLYSI